MSIRNQFGDKTEHKINIYETVEKAPPAKGTQYTANQVTRQLLLGGYIW